MRSLTLMALVFASASCLSSVTPDQIALCEQDSDCEGNETCDDGFCYGDPPGTLRFAAILQPPGDTANLEDGRILVPTEITELQISQSGELLNIQFEPHVTLTGSVQIPCDAVNDPNRPCGAIEATIEARRSSRIPGVPRFFRTFSTKLGANGKPTFTLQLPLSTCEDTDPETCNDSYVLIVTPKSGTMASVLPEGTSATTVEQLVPPQTFRVIADRSFDTMFEVGDPDDLKRVSGVIRNGAGLEGIGGYEVTAFGRVSGLSEPIQASTKAVTDNSGNFTLLVRTDLTELFDFVFVPAQSAPRTLPRVQIHDVIVPDPSSPEDTFLMEDTHIPPVPGTAAITVPITAISTGGARQPVPGAVVRFVTRFNTDDLGQPMTVTYSTKVTSSPQEATLGQATAELIAGQEYEVVVIPPPDSQFAARFDATVQVASADGTTAAIELPARKAMRGKMLNRAGEPIAAAPLTAQASPAFLWQLEADPEAVVDVHKIIRELVFTDVTEDDGTFFMWLDGKLAGNNAAYSLSIEPPLAADAPRWTFSDVTAPAESTDLGDLVLPRAAYAQGTIRDPDGKPVAGAKLEVYELTSASFCDNQCSPAPILRGIFEADSAGVVRPVVLPDPQSFRSRY